MFALPYSSLDIPGPKITLRSAQGAGYWEASLLGIHRGGEGNVGALFAGDSKGSKGSDPADAHLAFSLSLTKETHVWVIMALSPISGKWSRVLLSQDRTTGQQHQPHLRHESTMWATLRGRLWNPKDSDSCLFESTVHHGMEKVRICVLT